MQDDLDELAVLTAMHLLWMVTHAGSRWQVMMMVFLVDGPAPALSPGVCRLVACLTPFLLLADIRPELLCVGRRLPHVWQATALILERVSGSSPLPQVLARLTSSLECWLQGV